MINKKIFYLVFEIISLISIIFVTNNVWDKLEVNSSTSALAYTSESNLLLNVDNNLSALTPIDDSCVNKDEFININIYNVNNFSKNYNLYFIIKDNSLNTNYLKVIINNEINYLNELENNTIDNVTYYKIDTNKVDKQSNKNIKLYLYLASETPNSEQNKNMNIDFKIEEI